MQNMTCMDDVCHGIQEQDGSNMQMMAFTVMFQLVFFILYMDSLYMFSEISQGKENWLNDHGLTCNKCAHEQEMRTIGNRYTKE